MKLTSMPVVHRLNLILAIAFLGLITLAAIALYGLRAQMEHDAQRALRNLVESAHATVAHFHGLAQSGAMSPEAAKEAAKAALRAVRYGDGEYFWISDGTPRMLMDPVRPELEGRELGDIRDPTGKHIFREFAAVAGNGEAGFVDYQWPRPGDTAPQPRLAYVKAFEPWGWIVGSDGYVDDVLAAFTGHLYRYAAIVVAVMALLMLVAWRVARSITAQLGGEPAYAAHVMRRVAAGDLQVDVAVKGDNRNSLLAALAGMLGQLRTMMREIGGNAERVASNTRAIADVSRQVADATSGQADAASSIAAAVDEMTASIKQISDGGPEAGDRPSQEAGTAEKGEPRPDGAAREMGAIAVSAEAAAVRMRRLMARATEIGSITTVIKEISAQTNLLALNATIEAARAGEQGRGFGVVADEVRGLAERTATATVQIERMLGNIEHDAQSAMAAMSRVAGKVGEGAGRVREAAGSLRDIRAGTELALSRIRDVAEATREQGAASTTIAQQVEQIAKMVEGTSASMQSAVGAVEELEGLAARLHTMAARFRC